MSRVIHFEIHTNEPERAITFYSELFGWTFNKWGEMDYWVILTGEGPGIDGGLMKRPCAPEGESIFAYVCTVDVADVHVATARAIELGGVVAMPVMAVPTVGWLGYVKDTEGNTFGMMQMDPSAA
ncbi:glyoxalase [Armatimonadota bacterium]|nr:glyoxalase [Armatimonadota bacterium]